MPERQVEDLVSGLGIDQNRDQAVKQVADVMESAYPAPKGSRRKAAEKKAIYEVMSPDQMMKKAAQLEKKMLRHARDLEFEEAAKLRDEIQLLRSHALGLPDTEAG